MTAVWRIITLAAYFGLFLLLIAWTVWLEPPRRLPVALVLIVLVGPLLLPLRGLLHGRPYTHAWTSFMALFYFVAGVFNAAGAMIRPWLAWLEIALSVTLFFGAVFYARAKARKLKNHER
jgi:uncharacterized membrane protein